jgi:hypothetical protein
MTTETKVAIWVFCGVAGAGLGFALPWLLQVAARHPIPYADVLRFLGSFDSPPCSRPSASSSPSSSRIPREQVGGVHRRRGKVRIESPEGRVLFDDDVEGGKTAIAPAFRDHGYPWE